MSTSKIRVTADRRGHWMVLCPDGRYATCESIEDARRFARLSAAGAKPCELTVCDAYNRVVEHEFIQEDQPVLVG